MIIEIALGVALGLVIFVNWRGLLGFSTLVVLLLLLVAVTGVAGWALWTGLQAVRTHPRVLVPGSTASTVFEVGFGLLMNVMFAIAVSTVLEQRLGLVKREALVLGSVFYVLFLVSAVAVPMAIFAYFENGAIAAPLVLVLLFWIYSVLLIFFGC